MTGAILYSARKERLASPKYTMLLLAAVLMNVGVWAVEQGIDVNFEFLSVSYIVTEVMLILIYGMLRDYGIVQPGGAIRDWDVIDCCNDANVAMVFTGQRSFRH